MLNSFWKVLVCLLAFSFRMFNFDINSNCHNAQFANFERVSVRNLFGKTRIRGVQSTGVTYVTSKLPEDFRSSVLWMMEL